MVSVRRPGHDNIVKHCVAYLKLTCRDGCKPVATIECDGAVIALICAQPDLRRCAGAGMRDRDIHQRLPGTAAMHPRQAVDALDLDIRRTCATGQARRAGDKIPHWRARSGDFCDPAGGAPVGAGEKTGIDAFAVLARAMGDNFRSGNVEDEGIEKARCANQRKCGGVIRAGAAKTQLHVLARQAAGLVASNRARMLALSVRTSTRRHGFFEVFRDRFEEAFRGQPFLLRAYEEGEVLCHLAGFHGLDDGVFE